MQTHDEKQSLFGQYKTMLGAGLMHSLLTGGGGEAVLATVTASLLGRVTCGDIATSGTRKGGKILVGSPRVVHVDGSIAESYLKIIKEIRRRDLTARTPTLRISQSRVLRGECWKEAAAVLSRQASGQAPRGRKTLSSDEKWELENAAALEVLKKSTKSFVDGRIRVRHPGLRTARPLPALQRALEAAGVFCSWNQTAGSALLTYDQRKMSKSQFMQAVLPLARYLQSCA